MWTLVLMLVTVRLGACYPHYDITQTVSSVTCSIQRYFLSNCVIILQVQQNAGLEDMQRLVHLQKSLAETCSQVSILNSKTARGRSNESQNCGRPLHVIDMSRERTALTPEILVRLVGTKARWLLFVPDNITVEEIAGKVNIPPDCEFLVAQIRDGQVQLMEAYRVHALCPLEMHQMGNWTSGKGLQWKNTPMYDRRNNFHGLALRATVSEESLMTDIIRKDKDIKEVRGLIGDIWSALGQRVNFTNNFNEVSGWGMKTINGSWDGLIGRLIKDEADIALADFHMSAERLEVVDFLYTLQTTAVVLFMQQPGSTQLNGTIYLAPFKWQLWIALMAAMLLLVFFLSLSFYTAYHYTKIEQRHHSFWESLLSVFACFCTQGQEATPNSWSCLSVFLTAYFTGAVLIAAYSGALISFLAVQTRGEPPFRGFQGLLDDGSYRLGATPGSAVDLFRDSSNQVMQRLYKREMEPRLDTLPMKSREGFSRLCADPKYTFLESLLYYTVLKSQRLIPCDVIQVPETHKRESVSMAIKKGSPYTGFFSYNLLKMRSTGILSKIKSTYEVKTSQTVGVPIYGVRFEAVLPLICFMTIGVFLSTACLCVELGARPLLWTR